MIEEEYSRRKSLYKQLIKEICYILYGAFNTNHLTISNIEFRIKTFESFYDKIKRKEIDKDFNENYARRVG